MMGWLSFAIQIKVNPADQGKYGVSLVSTVMDDC